MREDPVHTCHRCPTRGRSPLCPATGRKVGDQAATGDCPEGRFAPRGLGDTVARVLHATGIGPAAKAAIGRVTGKPCGCAGRRAKLNALVPYRGPAPTAPSPPAAASSPAPRSSSARRS